MKSLLSIFGLMLALGCLAQVPLQKRAEFFQYKAAVGGGGAAVPGIVQYVSFNTAAWRSDKPNAWTNNNGVLHIPLNEPTSAGNTLVLGLSAIGTATSTFKAGDGTDNWTPATRGFNANNGIWLQVATNAAAGILDIYLTNSGPNMISNFNGFVAEAYNVAAYSPVDATNTAVTSSSGTLTGGSITPSTSGDLLIHFGARTDATGPTSFTAGSQANISWQNLYSDVPGQTNCSFEQWGVYASTAAINPQESTTPNGSSLSACVALKPATQGSARPGTPYIASVQHFNFPNGAVARVTPVALPLPSGCNLIVESASGSGNWYLTNVTDSAGNTWSEVAAGPINGTTGGEDGASDMWYASNATCSATLWITNFWFSTGSGDGDAIIYGVSGMSAYPFDFSLARKGFDPVNDNSGLPRLQLPAVINGSVTNELWILNEQHVTDTATNITSTATAMHSDTINWAGNSHDGPSALDQNGGFGHSKNANTSLFLPTWWFIANPGVSFFTTIAGGFMAPGGSAGGTNWALIQTTNINVSAGTVASMTFSKACRAGDTLIMCIQVPASRTLTVGDARNGAWTPVLAASLDGSGNTTAIYAATNIQAGITTATNKMSGANSYNSCELIELAGAAKYHPWDQVLKANATSTTTPSSGNATTTKGNELLIGWWEDSGSGGTCAAKSGWYMMDYQFNAWAAQIGVAPAVGTYSAQTTLDSSTSGSQTIVTLHQ